MELSAFQIHKVMKIYTKQLSQSKMAQRQKALGMNEKPTPDTIEISQEGRNRAVMDKVAKDIVDRITRHGPIDNVDRYIMDKLEQETGKKFAFKQEKASEFVFNVIDDDTKTTTSLSVEDTSFLLNRMEQLAKEAVEKDIRQQNPGENSNKP